MLSQLLTDCLSDLLGGSVKLFGGEFLFGERKVNAAHIIHGYKMDMRMRHIKAHNCYSNPWAGNSLF